MTAAKPQPADRTTPPARGRQSRLTGIVIRRSGDKTVAVEVTRVIRHPLYHKRQTRTKRYLAHDPENTATVGQTVQLRPTRPLSARKRWVVVPVS